MAVTCPVRLTGDKTRRLSFKGMGAGVARQMLPDGMKALAPSGAAVVGQEMKPDPVALGQPALSLLDVIPVTAHANTEFAYMRQTVRTNNAAVVAEGAVKPTSVYTVVRLEGGQVRSRDAAHHHHRVRRRAQHRAGAVDVKEYGTACSNKPLLQADPTQPVTRSISGVPLYSCPAVAADIVWAIPQQHAMFVLRSDASVVTDGSVMFTSDRTAIRATLRVGFGFSYPLSVVKISKA